MHELKRRRQENKYHLLGHKLFHVIFAELGPFGRGHKGDWDFPDFWLDLFPAMIVGTMPLNDWNTYRASIVAQTT